MPSIQVTQDITHSELVILHRMVTSGGYLGIRVVGAQSARSLLRKGFIRKSVVNLHGPVDVYLITDAGTDVYEKATKR